MAVKQIDAVLAACELSGGAVAPPLVLALCRAVRRYSVIVSTMAKIIDSAEVLASDVDMLTTMMIRARTVEIAGSVDATTADIAAAVDLARSLIAGGESTPGPGTATQLARALVAIAERSDAQ